MPRRVFIFLKKTENSVSYLPHRQLRKDAQASRATYNSYLPHRQLRKIKGEGATLIVGYLPHRQLRN